MGKTTKLLKNITKFHLDRNLIDGSTDQAQFKKGLEEFMELACAIYPNRPANQVVGIVKGMLDDLLNNGRIISDDGSGKQDACGDVMVVLENILHRNGYSLMSALETSYNEIKDRKGLMKSGVFYKYEDLTDEEKARFK